MLQSFTRVSPASHRAAFGFLGSGFAAFSLTLGVPPGVPPGVQPGVPPVGGEARGLCGGGEGGSGFAPTLFTAGFGRDSATCLGAGAAGAAVGAPKGGLCVGGAFGALGAEPLATSVGGTGFPSFDSPEAALSLVESLVKRFLSDCAEPE